MSVAAKILEKIGITTATHNFERGAQKFAETLLASRLIPAKTVEDLIVKIGENGFARLAQNLSVPAFKELAQKLTAEGVTRLLEKDGVEALLRVVKEKGEYAVVNMSADKLEKAVATAAKRIGEEALLAQSGASIRGGLNQIGAALGTIPGRHKVATGLLAAGTVGGGASWATVKLTNPGSVSLPELGLFTPEMKQPVTAILNQLKLTSPDDAACLMGFCHDKGIEQISNKGQLGEFQKYAIEFARQNARNKFNNANPKDLMGQVSDFGKNLGNPNSSGLWTLLLMGGGILTAVLSTSGIGIGAGIFMAIAGLFSKPILQAFNAPSSSTTTHAPAPVPNNNGNGNQPPAPNTTVEVPNRIPPAAQAKPPGQQTPAPQATR